MHRHLESKMYISMLTMVRKLGTNIVLHFYHIDSIKIHMSVAIQSGSHQSSQTVAIRSVLNCFGHELS
jgi:hypothetical protein